MSELDRLRVENQLMRDLILASAGSLKKNLLSLLMGGYLELNSKRQLVVGPRWNSHEWGEAK